MRPGSQGSGGLLIWVTHLYGIGHLRRASAIARACRELGLAVTLVSGGRPLPFLAAELEAEGIRLVQLPPLHSLDASFAQLVDADGREVDSGYLCERRRLLLDAFSAARPAVVLTEMYPFGRRSLRDEAEALIEAALAARPRPRLVASVRDLLVAKPPEKQRWMAEAATRYEAVLVHGDPALLRFEESFPFVSALGERLTYTGYVVTSPPAPASGNMTGADEVLVSAGGGAFGLALIEAALAARPLCPMLGHLPWRVLLGPNVPAGETQRLLARREPGLQIEPARADFPALLARCRLSISQAGVNTVLESLAAGARALVVPYAEAGETEQATRAARLAERGWLRVLDPSRLSPAALAEAAEAAARRPRPRIAINLDGARHSAEIIANMAAIVPPVASGEEE